MADLIGAPSAIPFIVLRTMVVYVFILVGFRLSGKREVGQLAPYDFALILLIANAVQNAMVGPDTSLLGGMVAAAVLLVLNYGLGVLAARNRKMEKLLRGKAHVLVLRGHVYQDALDSEHVTHQDLMQTLRAHGCCTIADCRLAVLEVDGSISVVPEATQAAPQTA
jgi:uncharacterized membrane protein YcaP (DUF421 family)